MSLYPGEIVIHDGNVQQHKQPPSGQGFGLVPRNYNTHPVGCYGAILPYHAVTFPLIDRSEWSQRAKDQIAAGARISDLRLKGNNGQPIPSRDQNGKGYCWAHSGVTVTICDRLVRNLPYADLSAYAVACIIKNYRDEGGWGAQGVDFLASRGVPTAQFWPQQSMSKANDNAATWADAAKHKTTEGWIDLAAAQYDRNLSFEQRISLCLTGCAQVADFNWWSHSVCQVDAVDGAAQWGITRADSGKLMATTEFDAYWGMSHPVTGGWGVRIWNSWGDSWSAQGMGTLTGNQAEADGGVAILSTTLSV